MNYQVMDEMNYIDELLTQNEWEQYLTEEFEAWLDTKQTEPEN